MNTKICSKCNIEKNISEYYNKKNGKTSQCKECSKKENKIYRENNKEKCNNLTKIWLKKNPDKRSDINKKYNNQNKDKIKEYQKEYRIKNIDKIKEIQKNNGKKTYQKRKEYLKIYSKENKYHSKYNKNRKKIDFNFKLKTLLRTRLYQELIKNNASKKISIIKLLNCSIPFLKTI
jgi:hypothetical protein